jgi:hypothetical protein
MAKKKMISEKDALILPEELILQKIFNLRGKKVMIDSDLANLYSVSTKRLNEQVKRNIKRFPDDFMFQLTIKEKQQVVANCDHLEKIRFSPYLPFVFTEHGTVMLASVLNSDKAIMVNIQIVRVFAKMRYLLEKHSEILRKIEKLQLNEVKQDQQIQLIFEYIKQLEETKQEEKKYKERKRIGY